MKNLFPVVARIFQIASSVAVWHFERNLAHPARAQRQTLKRCLKLAGVQVSIEEFRKHASVTEFQDYSGHLSQLTIESPLYFETTSGSTGSSKSVPYTPSLLKSFRHMFLLWVHDLLRASREERGRLRRLKTGRLFISLSPAIGETTTSQGLHDDSSYLGWIQRKLIRSFLAVHPSRLKAQDSETFFRQVTIDLLSARDLEIVSIWSPSYLISIIEYISENRFELAEESTICLATRVILRSERFNYSELWPELKLISCWNSAQAEAGASFLQELFPRAVIQGKGLLATEGPVTIPWTKAQMRSVPLVSEVFLEFRYETGKILALDEIENGETYELLLTTPGGLLRYRLGDLVRVNGYYRSTPCLEFVGRIGSVSDLVGEKLSEIAIHKIFKTVNLSAPSLLLPVSNGDFNRGYILVTEDREIDPEAIEQKLRVIHHYNLARNLRQLKPLRIFRTNRLRSRYLDFFEREEGMKRGDIKERVLLSNLRQSERLLAYFKSIDSVQPASSLQETSP
jgi:hypothetical protein